MLVIIFSIGQWQHHAAEFQSRKITVYNVHGHTAIDLFDRGKAIFFTDSVFASQRDRIRFHIHQNRLTSGIGDVVLADESGVSRKISGGRLFSWCEKTIAVINEDNFDWGGRMKVDYIIIGNNCLPRKRLVALKSLAGIIILDSSNSYFYGVSLMNEAQREGIEMRFVKSEGAFQERI